MNRNVRFVDAIAHESLISAYSEADQVRPQDLDAFHEQMRRHSEKYVRIRDWNVVGSDDNFVTAMRLILRTADLSCEHANMGCIFPFSGCAMQATALHNGEESFVQFRAVAMIVNDCLVNPYYLTEDELAEMAERDLAFLGDDGDIYITRLGEIHATNCWKVAKFPELAEWYTYVLNDAGVLRLQPNAIERVVGEYRRECAEEWKKEA